MYPQNPGNLSITQRGESLIGLYLYHKNSGFAVNESFFNFQVALCLDNVFMFSTKMKCFMERLLIIE